MSKKLFESFLEKMSEFPFWVKEVVYIKLREEFEQAYLSEDDMHLPIEEAYQAFVPKITFTGEQELAGHNNEEDEAIYRFLQFTKEEASIAEITLRNFWTLEKAAKVTIYCIQKEYIKRFSSIKIEAMALFLAGKIKIGEYFKRVGKIDVDQLNDVIRTQQELEKKGKSIKFAELMIAKKYISEKETKAVIYIKEECKKRFIFNPALVSKAGQTSGHVENATTPPGSSNTVTGNPEEERESLKLQVVSLKQECYKYQKKLKDIEDILER